MTFQRKNRFSLINLEINLIPHVKWDYIACSYCNHTWIDGIFRFATHYIRLLPFATHYIRLLPLATHYTLLLPFATHYIRLLPFATHYIYNIGALTVNIEFMWRGLETGERRAFSESFNPFRAEPHKFYIYCQYTNILFIL